MTAKKTLP